MAVFTYFHAYCLHLGLYASLSVCPWLDQLYFYKPRHWPYNTMLSHCREIPSDPLKQMKVITFEEKLLEPFRVCRICCSKSIPTITSMEGSMVHIVTVCTNDCCGHIYPWQSQPRIGKLAAGNLYMSMGILFSGSSATQVLRCLNSWNVVTYQPRTFFK